MNKEALLKALAISSIVTTIAMSLSGGYAANTTAEGVTTYHYSFHLVLFYMPVVALFVFPIIFIIGFPFARLLYRINAFNIFTVSIIGFSGGVLAVSLLFSVNLTSYQLVAPYGFAGLIGAITAYYAYIKFNKSSKPTTKSVSA